MSSNRTTPAGAPTSPSLDRELTPRGSRRTAGALPGVAATLAGAALVACNGAMAPAWTAPDAIPGASGPVASRWAGDVETSEGVTLVRATVDDTEGWFVLDTGSEVVLLDRSFADSVGLDSGRSLRLGPCDIPATLRRGRGFRFGPLSFDDPLFLTLELGPFVEELEGPGKPRISGILGRPVLEHAVLEVAYGSREDRVAVHLPGEGPARTGAAWTPSRWREGRPLVKVTLAGTSGWYAVDTGKSGTLSVASHFAARHGLPGPRPTSTAENRRLCGLSTELRTRMDVTVGDRTLDSLEVRLRVAGTEAARSESGAYAGVLGRGLLEPFTLLVDFPGRRLSLTPRPDTETRR